MPIKKDRDIEDTTIKNKIFYQESFAQFGWKALFILLLFFFVATQWKLYQWELSPGFYWK